MRKLIYSIVAVAALGLTACDNDDNNNNNGFGYAPNSCFATGGVNQYQLINGQCYDRRSGNQQPVPGYLCGQNQVGASYDPRCNQYTGWNTGFPNNGIPFGNNPNDLCSIYYGFGWYTEVLYTGQPICVNLGNRQWGNFNTGWGANANVWYRF